MRMFPDVHSRRGNNNDDMQSSSPEINSHVGPIRRASSVEDAMTGQWRQFKQKLGLVERVTEDEADR
ncbi:hypothetical protein SARC_16937, partial [Sphaeroforma arctica JP610]